MLAAEIAEDLEDALDQCANIAQSLTASVRGEKAPEKKRNGAGE